MTCVLDHPLISQRYFFPQRVSVPNPFWVASADTQNIRLSCWRRNNHPDGRTLVHFHGNGEVVADYLPDFDGLIDGMGLNLVLAEYRGYSQSSGTPALVAMLGDAVAVYEALDLEPDRVVAFGRSVGSIYALHLASKVPNLAGLVIESGIASPLERVLLRVSASDLGCTDDELKTAARRRLNHETKIGLFEGAMLVMHARNDGLVSVEHARALHRWAKEPKRLVEFELGDHNSIMPANHKRYFAELESFLNSLK